MLFEILPYVVGSAVSPVVLAMTVVLLAQPQKPVQKTVAFALGGTLTACVLGSIIFLTVHAQSEAARPTLSASIIHIILGLVLLVFAFQVWRKPPPKAPDVTCSTRLGWLKNSNPSPTSNPPMCKPP